MVEIHYVMIVQQLIWLSRCFNDET